MISPTAGELSFMFHGASMGVVTATIVIVALIVVGRTLK